MTARKAKPRSTKGARARKVVEPVEPVEPVDTAPARCRCTAAMFKPSRSVNNLCTTCGRLR